MKYKSTKFVHLEKIYITGVDKSHKPKYCSDDILEVHKSKFKLARGIGAFLISLARSLMTAFLVAL